MLRMSIIYELILNYAEYLGSLSQKPLFVRGTRCLPKEVKFVLTLIKPISGGMITTRLKHGIILRSQSTTWLASIRGQRPWKCVKVFLTVNENLRILQYLFISHRYQYLIYILLIFDKHWKFLYKKNYHLYIYFVFIWKQHAVNAFSAVHYHVIRHTEMFLEGFSREMPPILTCHLSWMISQQLGRVHGYVTETSFNVNT